MTSSWFIKVSGHEHPTWNLYCFPYSGGDVSLFTKWKPRLPESIALYAARLPGRGARVKDRPYTDVGKLTDDIASDPQLEFRQPFVLFGHSLGAIIAFELARRLAARGREVPEGVIVAGRPAPHIGPKRRLSDLPDDEFLSALERVYPSAHLKALRSDQELMRFFLPALRADIGMSDNYRCLPESPPLRSPLVAFAGKADISVDIERMGEWERYTEASFRQRAFDGGHFFIDEARDAVIDSVRDTLNSFGDPLPSG